MRPSTDLINVNISYEVVKFIERELLKVLKKRLTPNKVVILLGARRVGKTELINHYLSKLPKESFLQLNGDDMKDIDLLTERSVGNYKRLLKNISLLVIDEAQNIPTIGLILKLIVDSIDGIKVIATGSSMFDLSQKLGEPLVGRSYMIKLYPFAQLELNNYENYRKTKERLEERLIYGAYPELEQYDDRKQKQLYLNEIINSYLLKDILIFEGIKKSDKLYDLLKLIAFQVGKEVSLQELGNNLNLGKNTVERYLDLLSKVFVVYRLPGFSRNLRKEITKTSRWYFYDNGIRNAIIGNFNSISSRNDIGELWENYLLSERIKFHEYNENYIKSYFWRTYDQQEIDLIEENNGKLNAFEFKWNASKKSRIPVAFEKAYSEASYEIVNPNNYLDWIS